MKVIWQITLYETGTVRGGYRVKVQSGWNVQHEPDFTTIGKGTTPHQAYQDALAKRVVKPWLISEPTI